MAETFSIRQGDTASPIQDTLTDNDSVPVDIAGATVRFTLVPVGGGTPILNSVTAQNRQNGDGSDGSKGYVSYQWVAGNTDTAGFFLGSWEVTFAGGAMETFPNAGYSLVQVYPNAPTDPGSLYITREELKMTLNLRDQNFADDDIDTAIEAACRAVDEVAHRRYWTDGDTKAVRYYTPTSTWHVEIDDLISVDSLLTDYDGDGSYETSWTLNTDFVLEPLNANADGRPYERICLNPRSSLRFSGYPRSIKVTGQYGWPAVPAGAKLATTIVATKYLRRAREAPFGIVMLGPDGEALRIARTDPDVLSALAPVMRTQVLA